MTPPIPFTHRPAGRVDPQQTAVADSQDRAQVAVSQVAVGLSTGHPPNEPQHRCPSGGHSTPQHELPRPILRVFQLLGRHPVPIK